MILLFQFGHELEGSEIISPAIMLNNSRFLRKLGEILIVIINVIESNRKKLNYHVENSFSINYTQLKVKRRNDSILIFYR